MFGETAREGEFVLQALAKEKRKERKKRDTGNIFSVSFIFRETIRRINKILKLKENFEIILNCELEIITY